MNSTTDTKMKTKTMEKNEQERLRIGQRIAELRHQQNITQQELSERTGIRRAHISRIEGGKYSVGFDALQNIATALGKNIDFI